MNIRVKPSPPPPPITSCTKEEDALIRALRQQKESLEIENERLRQRVTELEKSFKAEPCKLPHACGLTPQERHLFFFIVSKEIVTNEQLRVCLTAGAPKDSTHPSKIESRSDGHTRIVLMHIRDKLRAWGIEIKTIHSVGYFIPEDIRQKLLAGTYFQESDFELSRSRQKRRDVEAALREYGRQYQHGK